MAGSSWFDAGIEQSLSIPKGIAPYKKRASRRRRINPRAGHALEILGHAIEYLVDELLFKFEGEAPAWRGGRIEAIRILMATDRLIYFECPEVPTLKDRILAFLPWHKETIQRGSPDQVCKSKVLSRPHSLSYRTSSRDNVP